MQTRRQPPKRGGRKSAVTLQELLSAGLISSGETLVAEHKGKALRAKVRSDAQVTFKGATHGSLSVAAGAAKRSVDGPPKQGLYPHVNGWTFWRVKREGQRVPIGSLRDEFDRSVSHAP